MNYEDTKTNEEADAYLEARHIKQMLRDKIAIQAMQGILEAQIARYGHDCDNYTVIAGEAYRMADIMIVARKANVS